MKNARHRDVARIFWTICLGFLDDLFGGLYLLSLSFSIAFKITFEV